jgi:hypothetical protein
MDAYRPRLRAWLVVAAILIVGVLAFRGIRALRAEPHAGLRDTIADLRSQADSCRAAVDVEVAALRAWDLRLDSMRARVRAYEALDTRGVPADSFVIYMQAFRAYNDSVAAWPPREDSVRAMDTQCRAVAEQHNALTDSLRRLVLPRD